MLETETIYPGGNPPTEKKGFWKKFEDKMEERRANVFRHKPLSWTVVVWWGLVLFTSIIAMKSCNTTEPVPSQPAFGCEVAEEQVVEPVPETLFDEVYDYIFKLLSDSQKQSMYQMKEQEDYLSNAERRMDKVTWKHKPYLFQWGDVIINVWVVSEFSHEYVTLDSGIKFAKVMSVIRKKIAYQRNKDRAFLINLAYRFLGMVGANWKNLSAVFNQDYR